MARKAKAKPAKAAEHTTAPPATPGKLDRFAGRLASDVRFVNVDWLLHPWIPSGMLSFVVGQPSVGKSTFLATLIAFVTNGFGFGQESKLKENVVLLPGYEESFDSMTGPRLKAADADLRRVHVLDRDHYSLIRDRESLARRVKASRAKLLVIDPIDSYLDEGLSEDRGQDVRPFLEAAARIGEEAACAVVCARHPGKDRENVCPGSRQWRAVPRVIALLSSDGNFPPKYTISHFKDSLGTHAKARGYDLKKEENGFRQFILLDEMDRSAQELAANTGGPTSRYKLMTACRLVRWYFDTEDKPTRAELGKEALKQGLGEDTIAEALRLLGIKSVPPSERGLPWVLVRMNAEWPTWLPGVPPLEDVGEVRSSPAAGPETS